MFQSVYDYPYLSSSANHIFDITVGVSANTSLTVASQQTKKQNIYNQMAQVLVGYDHTGSIQEFDEDGNILAGGTKLREVFFLNFSRLLCKDEIKKGSFEISLGVNSDYSQTTAVMNKQIKITDYSGSDGYFVNSPAGEYGVLYATSSLGESLLSTDFAGGIGQPAVGLLFYQAGIAVISGSVFHDSAKGGVLHATRVDSSQMVGGGDYAGFDHVTGSEISASANAIRNRIYNPQFNN